VSLTEILLLASIITTVHEKEKHFDCFKTFSFFPTSSFLLTYALCRHLPFFNFSGFAEMQEEHNGRNFLLNSLAAFFVSSHFFFLPRKCELISRSVFCFRMRKASNENWRSC